LRQEQNREFEEGLIRDQIRELQQQKLMSASKAEEEARQKEIERKQKQEDRNSLFNQLKAKFGNEVADNERSRALLLLRMPNGERLQRSFFVDVPLEEVQQWAIMKLLEKNRDADLDFVFVSDFPRRVMDDMTRTLAEHGIVERTLLTVSEQAVSSKFGESVCP